jgi:hypothetical protein
MALPLTLLAIVLCVVLIALCFDHTILLINAPADPIQKSTDEYVWEPCKICNGTHAVLVKKADLERVQLSK